MANKKNTTINTTAAPTTPVQAPSASDPAAVIEKDLPKVDLGSIRDALIWVHNDNNRHAIGQDELLHCNVTEQAFSQWKAYVEDLRKVVNDYIDTVENRDKSETECESVRSRIWSRWKAVLKDGTGKEFDRKFFIRSSDPDTLARRKFINSCRGKMQGHMAPTEFRCYVETLIGLRMADNAVLDDGDRDLLAAYDGAVASVKSADQLLQDRTDDKGKLIEGLITKQKNAQLKLDWAKKEHNAAVAALGMQEKTLSAVKELPEDVKKALLSGLIANVEARKAILASAEIAYKEADDAKKAQEKRKTDAEKIISEKEKDYKALTDRLVSL